MSIREGVFDKPFRDRIFMPRGGRHVVLVGITWGIQIEETVQRVIQGVAGLITKHTGA